MNTSAKGNKREREIVQLLAAAGYEVSMARLSKGAFDRFATREFCVLHGVEARKCLIFREAYLEKLSWLGKEGDLQKPCQTITEHRYIQSKSNNWCMGTYYANDMRLALIVPLPEPCSREFWRVSDGGDRADPLTFMRARRITRMNGELCEYEEIPLLPEWRLWRPEIVPEAFVQSVVDRRRKRA